VPLLDRSEHQLTDRQQHRLSGDLGHHASLHGRAELEAGPGVEYRKVGGSGIHAASEPDAVDGDRGNVDGARRELAVLVGHVGERRHDVLDVWSVDGGVDEV
jgi:hypothetical protein